MKTIVIILCSLFAFAVPNLQKTEINETVDKYIIPKDAKKAAILLNKAFAKEFEQMKFKASAKNISYANQKEFFSLISKNGNLSKNHKEQILKEFSDFTDLRATILELTDSWSCDEGGYFFVVEAGDVQTRIARVMTTCNYLGCLLSGVDLGGEDGCPTSDDPLQPVKICRNFLTKCCLTYYCRTNECPRAQCEKSSGCTNCND